MIEVLAMPDYPIYHFMLLEMDIIVTIIIIIVVVSADEIVDVIYWKVN